MELETIDIVMSSPPPTSAGTTMKEENPVEAANPDSSSEERTSFVCQRCVQPLRIHPSLFSMDEHTLAEVTLATAPAPKFQPQHNQDDDDDDQDGEEGKLDLSVPAVGLDESGPGFTLVGETGDKASPHARLKTAAELFKLVSSNGRIDHPLCEECTDSLLDSINQQLRLSEAEAQEYKRCLSDMDRQKEDDGQVEMLRRELEQLEAEESGLQRDLERLKQDQARAEADFKEQAEARDKLEKEELRYWKEYSKYKRELMAAEDDYKSLDYRLRYSQGQLDRLKKLNVFNATFNIWHTGHFATINGFRLGRLPSVPVEWSEINAAWGQTAFLLASLAEAVGMDGFQRYQIVPYGNYSYVKVLADGKSLPLYGSGGFRMIFDSKFDSAMVAFLDCLQQFAVELHRQGGFSLPYEMDKGKIRDNNTGQFYSVKLQFNSEDSWTKALRYMLTNLKWGLAFVSSKHVKQDEADGGGAATADAGGKHVA